MYTTLWRSDVAAIAIVAVVLSFIPDAACAHEPLTLQAFFKSTKIAQTNAMATTDEEPLEVDADYSGRLFWRYSDDDTSGMEKWESEFELNLDVDNLSYYLRLSDLNYFPDQNDPWRWEKGYVKWKDNDFKLTAGSFGALFGRGLTLNMYEDRLLEHDNELEGVKIEYEFEDFDITALYGVRRKFDDIAESEVRGARVEYSLGRGSQIGASIASIEFPDTSYTDAVPRNLNYDVYAGDISLKLDDLKIYGEAAALRRDEVDYLSNSFDSNGDDGEGYFVSASYFGNGFTASAEYKYYRGMGQPFSVLPSVRRWEEQAAATPDDDEGYNFQLLMTPWDDGTQLKALYSQDNSLDKNRGYTEAAFIYTSPPTRRTTWIGEYWHVFESNTDYDIQRLTVNHQYDDDWTFGVHLEREAISPGFTDDYTDFLWQADLSYKSDLNIVYTQEQTGKDTQANDQWGLLEVLYRPRDDHELNLSYGQRRAGFVCSGGVCRLEPEFDGFRIDYQIRF
jgi:hypothetical protein